MNFEKVDTRIRKALSTNVYYPEYRCVWFGFLKFGWEPLYYIENNSVKCMCGSVRYAEKVIDDFIARGYTLIDPEPQITNYP